MKFRVESESFANAVVLVAKAAASNAHLAHLGAVRLSVEGDKLSLAATDHDVSMVTTLAVSGGEEGSVLIPAPRLVSAAKAMPEGAVDVEVDRTAELSCGPVRFHLPLVVGEGFPAIPAEAEGSPIDGAAFQRALVQCAPAMSKADSDSARLKAIAAIPDPAGALLMATEIHRLHEARVPGLLIGEPAIFPARSVAVMREFSKATSTTLSIEDRRAVFAFDETVVTCQLVEGAPPPYRTFITNHQPVGEVEVDSAELLAAFGRLTPLVGPHAPVRMTYSDGSLRLKARSDDGATGSDEVAIDWPGDTHETGLNPRWLTEAVKAAGGEQVVLSPHVNPLAPTLIKPADDDGFTAVIMPNRSYTDV